MALVAALAAVWGVVVVAGSNADAIVSPGCVVDTTGLIGAWPGTDLTARVGPDLTGSASIGAGRIGSALSLGGADIVGAAGLPAVSTGVTAELWVKPNPNPSGRTQALVTRWEFPGTSISTSSFSLRLDAAGGLIWSTDEDSAIVPVEFRAAASQLFDGAFHHVAATWDALTIAIYVDGVVIGSRPSQGGRLNAAATTPFRVGSEAGIGDPLGFNGSIDELGVWNRALTAEEVAAIAASTTVGRCTPTPVLAGKAVSPASFANDRLGSSIAIDGTTVVAGSPFNSARTQFGGSASVFSRTGTTLALQATLTPSDPGLVDFFGNAVAVSGDTVVVGSYANNGVGTDSGAAYVFVRTGTTWTQQAKLFGSETTTGDQFGFSVAIDGDLIAIGAPLDDLPGLTDAGAVYVFARTGGVWLQQAKVVAAAPGTSDTFGSSVALDAAGGRLAVGVPQDDGVDDLSQDAGSLQVSLQTGTTWSAPQVLAASGVQAGDRFGAAVAISPTTVVAGAPLDDDLGNDSGAAYVFNLVGGAYAAPSEAHATEPGAGDHFGASVATDDTLVAVGAPFHSGVASQAGKVFVLARADATWGPLGVLVAADAAGGDWFGVSVAADAGTFAVGASLDDDRGSNSGSGYLFSD
ncbi:MAG: LamG-like jellyroll fold domain-containing protein [Ilumatobacteraceae bacterium]